MSYAEMSYGATGTEDAIVVSNEEAPAASALQQMAAERLAAHRNRKAQAARVARKEMQTAAEAKQSGRSGAARIREAVAARYESSVSYREFLASETERALEQVQAAAESAARGAQAAAEAQMRMLQEMEQWNRTEKERAVEAVAQEVMQRSESVFVPELHAPELHVRLQEDLPVARAVIENARVYRDDAVRVSDEELAELEQEIEFRLSPDFAGHNLETQTIPANIIEFPRQLVAPRKARPRLAEGPLRDESEPEAQLRIFEVEAEQISMEAADSMEIAPEWQSLQLGAAQQESNVPVTPVEFAIEPQTAALHLRMMAALVDGCCMMAAFLGFACVAMHFAGPQLRALPLPLMGMCAAATLTVIFVLYQMLFFTLAESTPGMRYARIGLCTFGDSNPTRKAMRRRVWAKLLAASPLGLGVIWMALDGEGLGWHDRMTRMYPRAY